MSSGLIRGPFHVSRPYDSDPSLVVPPAKSFRVFKMSRHIASLIWRSMYEGLTSDSDDEEDKKDSTASVVEKNAAQEIGKDQVLAF